MKKLAIISAMIVLQSALGGCSNDFIDLTNPSAFTEKNYYKTADDLKGALTASYSSLQPVYDLWYRWSEIPSDNTQGRSDGGGENQIDVFTLGATYVNIYSIWQALYKTIATANIVLEKAPAINMDETLKARYMAEAKALRALGYYNLVRMFGGVPLITVTLKSPDEALTYKRESVDKIYAQIKKDLTEAETVLPPKYEGTANKEVGRITAIAVKTMLGEVLMVEKDWPGAALKLKEAYDLCAANGTGLLPNYADIFDPAKGNNQEIIWAVQYQRGRTPLEGSGWPNYFAPIGSGTSVVKAGSAYGYNQISPSLFNAFEAGDKRLPVSIGIFTTSSSKVYYTRKYIDPEQVAPSDAGNDWIIYRYADLLLLYAEALNENNETASAAFQLNKVRARAGLAEKTGLTQITAREAIELERRLELSCEGHRWFDLVRTNRVSNVMTAHFAAYPIAESTGAVARMENRHFLYPIPDVERTINPDLTQNDGY